MVLKSGPDNDVSLRCDVVMGGLDSMEQLHWLCEFNFEGPNSLIRLSWFEMEFSN